ncbi:bifunctional diaminohydroxyphosphoribosylaminopyrimidine deaminase/5-amino-6-(5-phosphoribosylamino)uracil reductase RibD [Dyadobacter sp. CY343]|uniref:bifunctional diaminohydroxyphosphoribosylaminopyrimidine deaminase/5-amino-6-(5-phosphoribosylamino)uracil reductase RibD n=1 Tax=Dyadobacter sp. CY343 TaxID=2907299 RepID=UPI001F0160BE|nr:bifunctional diaminohydroxyphosphoribosylaminopyrimidine deaminase/5-amino-6-(5-phosphoribosylamino)uracil reductase RibD [Dyadobacter sp. CY343]MCE7061829.1 bifunctional diaminohydroxyphosphoribosylaminopyrimidine deaminase/5-amino-6-(5-phosphoribosylamino)uracil reductase RibD [Dyadobacter sp. CY343]
METDIQWMGRALQLAEYGRGNVSPNPMVGCVIVHNETIIGEGWHRHYGGPHAEVWAVEDAKHKGNAALLSEATAYVTLEPCSHIGKTPPCADLLIRHKLKRVVICNPDPNPLVSGRGIQKLADAGIEVITQVLNEEGLVLNKRFFNAMTRQRPYVILKWAETADGFIGYSDGPPVAISGALSNMRVHKWRTEEDAILVGFKTALADNPQLNVRHWAGRDPVRIVLDRYLQLPETLNLFDNSQATIVVNFLEETKSPAEPERYSDTKAVSYLKISSGENEIGDMLEQLWKRKIHSVFVEGGTTVINAFLQSGLWDEIRRCQAKITIGKGTIAPVPKGTLTYSEKIENDLWTYYSNS